MNLQSSANTKSKSTSSTAFGGMKKGFLFGAGSKAQRKTASTSSKTAQGGTSRATPGASAGSKEEEVPFLKAQQQEKQAGMRLDEVQEEMKKAYPLLQTQGTFTST